MIENAIYHILSNDAGVSGKISTRIYPMVAPENASVDYYCTYQIISSATNSTKSSIGDRDTFLIQIDAYGPTNTKAAELGQDIRTALEGYSGTANGVVIEYCDYKGQNDTFEELENLFRKSYDFEILKRL